MAVTVSDVEKLSAKSWNQLPNDHKQALLEDAQSQANTIYSGQVSTLPSIEGDNDVFVKYLAAHLYELAEGGEATSENSAGGSVNYNLGNPNESYMSLSQTRYGRTCIGLLSGRSGISIIRSW